MNLAYYNTFVVEMELRHAQGNNLFISMSPRYALEALGRLLYQITQSTPTDS
jgi:hypothetical protein